MVSPTDFNPEKPSVMHLDLNSAFATIEQQANPLLRGKPIVVVAYDSPGGCILASSVEAKRLGIKTGHRVRDAQKIYPRLITLPSDPHKYRQVHLAMRKILADYTPHFFPRSIDDFALHFQNIHTSARGLQKVGLEIKRRIKSEIGDYLTVSIGLAPNRFLAKLASNLQKPNGLEEINSQNFLDVYRRLQLTDLCGISFRNETRLRIAHIHSVLDFYHASPQTLKIAFRSVLANYWYARLRGYEVDNYQSPRKSFGNSYALPHSTGSREELLPILQKLVEKTSFRLRQSGYQASGIHLALYYRDRTHWHKGLKLKNALFDSAEIYREMVKLLSLAPAQKPVHTLHETCFGLISNQKTQLDLFKDILQKKNLVASLDAINSRWGNFVISPARMILAKNNVPDRIAFGGIREL
jgi:DNA polymerase-4